MIDFSVPISNRMFLLNPATLIQGVQERFPFIEIKFDDVLFQNLRKCTIVFDEERSEIRLTTNSSLLDYCIFACHAICTVTGENNIYDYQTGETRSLSNYQQIIDDFPKFLERNRTTTTVRVYKIIPQKGEAFRYMDIVRAVDALNRRTLCCDLDQNGRYILLLDPSGDIIQRIEITDAFVAIIAEIDIHLEKKVKETVLAFLNELAAHLNASLVEMK